MIEKILGETVPRQPSMVMCWAFVALAKKQEILRGWGVMIHFLDGSLGLAWYSLDRL